ncbi:MAG: hypothetical protein GC156_03870 [Actinomycetales bacterium]|nr:hypothetical protein [Actinomycetales bacterium]
MNPTSSPARLSRLATVALAALAVLMSTLVGALPAQAATYTVTFSPKNGTVGVSMDLSSSVSSGEAGVATGTVTYYADGVQIATATVDNVGTVAAAKWTPTKAGDVPMFAQFRSDDGTISATSAVTTVTFAQVSTKTDLAVPNTAKISTAVTLTATVVPSDGSYVPTGTVTFQLSNGAVLASANLDSKGIAKLSVQMPASPTNYQVKATYNGDDNAKASTSGTESIQVTTSGSVIALSLSAGPYAIGKAITLTAAITPSSSKGSVSFRANNVVIGAVGVSNGKAVLAWKPTAGGAITLTASFIPSGSTKVLGTDTQKITIAANLPVNTLTIGPVGQTPWKDGQTIALRYMSTIPLGGGTLSKAPVNLAISGSCHLDGATIVPNAGAGTCTLVSTSPATAQYQADRQVNTIVLARGRQTAAVVAPTTKSHLKRYRTYRLANPGTKSTSGNTVTWRVLKGRWRCAIINASDGSTYLRTKRLGWCRVRAYSPPVAGQWLRYKKIYKYKVVR